ncbi:hypothetical protein SDC9_210689 [bioreactor metagenome]|uniref:Uncharacterized protein n=1 Tax=bioreactor metagenome TaxID=1076179 RepID=A0A645JHM4_9ZZZZ
MGDEALGNGAQGIDDQCGGQDAADLVGLVQADRQHGAEQVADIVPGGEGSGCIQPHESVADQHRQQRRVGKAPQAMDHDERHGSGKQRNPQTVGWIGGVDGRHGGTPDGKRCGDARWCAAQRNEVYSNGAHVFLVSEK